MKLPRISTFLKTTSPLPSGPGPEMVTYTRTISLSVGFLMINSKSPGWISLVGATMSCKDQRLLPIEGAAGRERKENGADQEKPEAITNVEGVLMGSESLLLIFIS